MTEQQLFEWLINRKEKINKREVARDCGMPEPTLRKFLNGEKLLPEHYRKTLKAWIRKFSSQNPNY